MTVEYQKTQLTYGGYRSERAIWITLLNGQRALKFNILDRNGNVLYRVERKFVKYIAEIFFEFFSTLKKA